MAACLGAPFVPIFFLSFFSDVPDIRAAPLSMKKRRYVHADAA